MSHKEIPEHMITLALVLMLLIGCSPPQVTQPPTKVTPTLEPLTTIPTPVPPSTAPPSRLPTATSQPFTLVTSAKEIIGRWVSGNYYIRFDEDGTFRMARSLERLESQPYAIGSYSFDGTSVVIADISVSGVPSCGTDIGKYEIQVTANGNIRVMLIEDPCRGRRGDISRGYQPVR